MVKEHPPRGINRRGIKHSVEIQDGCWVDIYELPWFSGKVRRLHGPTRLDRHVKQGGPIGSLIVGPEAAIGLPRSAEPAVLKPKQIVPEFAQARLAGKLAELALTRVKITPDSPRRGQNPVRRFPRL